MKIDPDDIFDENDGDSVPIRYAITSYGADYAIETLVQRMNKNIMFVPDFQRKYVWSAGQASRFIESLILGLPVPGVFLAKEDDTGRLLIIDGQQRLKTIQSFVNGILRGKEFALEGVQSALEGKTYRKLSEHDKNALNDSVLHATVIRQDSPSDDQSSIYLVFQRLNTGGTQLQPQEIRACIFHGAFDQLLKTLNQNASWRNVFGKHNARLKDEELILRFLAFLHDRVNYSRPVAGFLNSFMGRYKSLGKAKAKEFTSDFVDAISLVDKALGKGAFRPDRSFNAAVFDSVMVSLAQEIRQKRKLSPDKVRASYKKLLANKEYLAVVSKATGDDSSVKARFSLAEAAFK